MGKAPNGLGKFSGKVGGVVFAISNGEQIVRAYQPVVNNPKSGAQQLQRAKGNLVGRLSAITPYQVLTGLGANRRARRSRFLQLALRAATSTPVSGMVGRSKATIADEDLKFSEGAIVPTINVSSVTASQYQIQCHVQKMSGVASSDFEQSGVIVIAVVCSDDGTYETMYYRHLSNEQIDVSTGLDISFYHLSEGSYHANVYVVPFSTTDGANLATVAGGLFGEDYDFSATMDVNPAALPVAYGNSFLSAQGNYTAA